MRHAGGRLLHRIHRLRCHRSTLVAMATKESAAVTESRHDSMDGQQLASAQNRQFIVSVKSVEYSCRRKPIRPTQG